MENEQTQTTEQPAGLFDYIAGQQLVAVPTEEAVNFDPAAAPTTTVSDESSEQVPTAASGEQEQSGVTPGPASVSQDDLLRLQQENEQLRRSHSDSLSALALVATEAKKREDALFEQNIRDLPEDDQNLARERREWERTKAENELFKANNDRRSREVNAAQENIDKARFAQLIASQLQLPNDPNVAGVLLESASPQEMVFRAQRMQQFLQATATQQTANVAQQAARNGVHAAGGETAPPTAPKKTEQRSGNLIDMMQERKYEAQPINV